MRWPWDTAGLLAMAAAFPGEKNGPQAERRAVAENRLRGKGALFSHPGGLQGAEVLYPTFVN